MTDQALLNPYAYLGQRIVNVDDVPRGQAGLTCLECDAPMCKKDGGQVRAHFSHIGGDENTPCRGAESLLHGHVKEVFLKYFEAGNSNMLSALSRTLDDSFCGDVSFVRYAKSEVIIPAINRRIDLLLGVDNEGDSELYFGRYISQINREYQHESYIDPTVYDVALEIAVTNRKNEAYVRDIERIALPTIEIIIPKLDAERWLGHFVRGINLYTSACDFSGYVQWLSTHGLPPEEERRIEFYHISPLSRKSFKWGQKCPNCGGHKKSKFNLCQTCFDNKHTCPECGGRKNAGYKLCRECHNEKYICPLCENWKGEEYELCYECGDDSYDDDFPGASYR